MMYKQLVNLASREPSFRSALAVFFQKYHEPAVQPPRLIHPQESTKSRVPVLSAEGEFISRSNERKQQ